MYEDKYMMYLAVYLNAEENKFLHFLISLFTWSDATHTELVFSDGKAVVVAPFGSTTIVDKEHPPYNWDLIPLPWISEEQESVIREQAEYIVEHEPRYDYMGALFGWWSDRFDDSDKWFCSELCAYLLLTYTPALDSHKWFSPETLWKDISTIYEDYMAAQ